MVCKKGLYSEMLCLIIAETPSPVIVAPASALAGATITGDGVSAMIKQSISLYKPFLQTIASN